MVLWAPRLKRKFIEQGRAEGRAEGFKQAIAAYEAWLKRKQEAEANNQPFDEPPPSLRTNNHS